MKTIPVTIPYFDEKEEQAVVETLRSGWVAQGPKVAEFEQKIAEHEGVNYAIATSSCTSALHIAMLTEGMREGTDAIIPSFTFVATANAVIESGATPVLVDIKQETYTIDPLEIEKKIANHYRVEDSLLINKNTGNTLWGIVAVHQFGLCADMVAINSIAKKYNIKVIEDAACALGAKIGDTHQGTFGNISCVSFHPRKSISTGEGGMVLCGDEALAKKMRELRSHGCSVSADARHAGKGFLLPEFNEAGYNYRMTDIQASIGIEQIKKFDYILEERRRRAWFYDAMISEIIPELVLPFVPKGYYHSYQSYVCMLDIKKLGINSIEEGGAYRNKLLERLEDDGIQTRQGTHAVHMLGYYKNRFAYQAEDIPNSYACDRLSISLPLYVQMTNEDQKRVVATLKKYICK